MELIYKTDRTIIVRTKEKGYCVIANDSFYSGELIATNVVIPVSNEDKLSEEWRMGSGIMNDLCREFNSVGIVINSIINPKYYNQFGFSILGVNPTPEGKKDNAIVMVRHPQNFFRVQDDFVILNTVGYI